MTERPPRPSALEWRLYLVTVLAGVYVLTWRAITGAPAPAAPVAPARPPIARTGPAPLVLPPGWRLATTDEGAPPALAPAAPRPIKLRPTRTRRIRTRSS